MTKTVGVIGAGIGGLALSIRLANQGFKVTPGKIVTLI
jgi:phytoene dehydrogenase-like protein